VAAAVIVNLDAERLKRQLSSLDDTMSSHYILDGHTPVPVKSFYEWARWYEKANRRVAETCFPGIRVSTVFLSLDHGFGNLGMPILFETMVFGGLFHEEQWRYATWEEAEQGHADLVAMVEALLRRLARYDQMRASVPRAMLPKRAPFRRPYAQRARG
jgi:hypothetical protein